MEIKAPEGTRFSVSDSWKGLVHIQNGYGESLAVPILDIIHFATPAVLEAVRQNLAAKLRRRHADETAIAERLASHREEAPGEGAGAPAG